MKNKSIVLIFILLAGIALAYFLSGKEEPARKKAVIGLQAPEFELKDIGGKVWRLADFRGKVVLINFWATWCDTCKEENPSLQRLMEAEKENGEFAVVTVLYNDSALNAASYLKTNNFGFIVLIDDKKASADYGITGLPETFIISRNGILKKKFIGPERWDTPDMNALLKRFIDET